MKVEVVKGSAAAVAERELHTFRPKVVLAVASTNLWKKLVAIVLEY
jgi:hypothetical protein